MYAQAQCQKRLAAFMTVCSVLLKSSWHAPTDLDPVAATQLKDMERAHGTDRVHLSWILSAPYALAMSFEWPKHYWKSSMLSTEALSVTLRSSNTYTWPSISGSTQSSAMFTVAVRQWMVHGRSRRLAEDFIPVTETDRVKMGQPTQVRQGNVESSPLQMWTSRVYQSRALQVLFVPVQDLDAPTDQRVSSPLCDVFPPQVVRWE